MNRSLRQLGDKTFTFTSAGAVLLMCAALVIILGPILWKGAGAVVFRGTVEWRKLQLDLHGRGNAEEIAEEIASAEVWRRQAYDMLDHFSQGLNPDARRKEVRKLYREFKKQLRHQRDNGDITDAQQDALERDGKKFRNQLQNAFETNDAIKAEEYLNTVLACQTAPRFADTLAEQFFQIATEYRQIVRTVDLSRREDYSKALGEVRDAMRKLFGPRPGQPKPEVIQDQYGVTRWDMAEKDLDKLLYATTWVKIAPGQPLEKKHIPRSEQFAGTSLEKLFPFMQENINKMLLPERTIYWQYFIDDSTTGHYFGGVGPEIIGTVLLTVLPMLLAFPLGVGAAAYLAETNEDNLIIRVIRTCINTLAGVPSIIFGLFGMVFFVLWFLPGGPIITIGNWTLYWPGFGCEKKSSILAGALTLSVLILPVIIRASEEAIRAVPRAYKEASLALGASGLRTFLTVTLPAALPGILTGVILSMSRAAGETAPLLFTAAVAFGRIPHSILDPTRTLSYGSYDIAVGDRLSSQVPHQQYGMVMTLILLVLLLNVAAIILRWRVARKLRGH